MLFVAMGAMSVLYVRDHLQSVKRRQIMDRPVAYLEGAPGKATVYWLAGTCCVVVASDRLAPAPSGKVYQLWCFVDGKPRPCGTFQSLPGRRIETRVDMEEHAARVEGFAVTLEQGRREAPEGPVVLK
jgi:anti-sigma-K factor RskA